MKIIERVPVVQQVAENLQEYITSGRVEIGQKLPPEKELCAQMNVGRGTVREAFRILQTSGLVEIKPGRGAFVARTGPMELENIIEWFQRNEVEQRDCIEIRSAIEPLAIRLTIERCTDADIQLLSQTHQKFIAATEKRDAPSIAQYDECFHNQIVEKSQNKLLISINRKVSECVQMFRHKTFLVEQNIKNAVQPHTDIFNAIQSRDIEAGEMYMRRHIERILSDLTSITTQK